MNTFASTKSEKMNYRKEHIIYVSMWILLYVSPILNLYMRIWKNPYIDFRWDEVFNAWIFTTVLLAIFLVHNFLLVPLLIQKRKTVQYLLLALALLLVGMAVQLVFRPKPRHFWERGRMQMKEQFDSVSMNRMARIRLGDGRFCRPEHARSRRLNLRPIDPVPMIGPGEMAALFSGILLMGMNIGVKLFFKSEHDRKRQEAMERHNLEQQMEYLKYQVNPHFFMNTLNNIHALVDINPERAKTTIVELSKMMRHILYEGNNKLIPLPREIEFLNNYIQLMRMRYNKSVRIDMTTPDKLPDCMLPPLLLIIFVENAFKHGISYRTESFIDISIDIEHGRLLFECRNSIPPKQSSAGGKKGGIGLVNVRRRLDIIFSTDYTLSTQNDGQTYCVRLNIPLAPPQKA